VTQLRDLDVRASRADIEDRLVGHVTQAIADVDQKTMRIWSRCRRSRHASVGVGRDQARAAPRPHAPHQGRRRGALKPSWIRARAPSSPRFYDIKRILREHNLHTVCEEASCPNIGECFGKARRRS
jgi:hypothetical protein